MNKRLHSTGLGPTSLGPTGLGLFSLSIVVAIGLLFTGEFTLTETLLRTHVKPQHHEDLRAQLAEQLGNTFATSFQLGHTVNTAIEHLNTRYKAEAQWDKVIYDNYALALVRAGKQAPTPLETYGWWACLLLALSGIVLSLLPASNDLPGVRNNGIFHSPLTARGWIGVLLGSFLIAFYIALYFYPEYIIHWILLADPLSRWLSGQPASQWFLYGLLYTLAVLVMGARMLYKYRHLPYQQVRTASVMFFQLAFAFLIPELLVRFNKPYFDFKNMWPLDYDFFFDWHLESLLANGSLGIFMLGWGIGLFVIGVPVLTYFFGKRWYCSWVCGCGGLAETLGDPFRQLSDKSLRAWKIERYSIHAVLGFAVLMTAFVLYTYFTGSTHIGFIDSYTVRSVYGFGIGSIFSGVVGTGFYPLMGNRVWCRFGCPLAAYLGLVQRYRSRFRITTNGGQCISCGNCSTYCEMGIDVRAYAQRGQDIVRSSCVGCGVCSAVCPRGVLQLENAAADSRVTIAPDVLLGNTMLKK